MGKGWDDMGEGAQQREWHKAWLAQAYRVLKPSGLILAFNGTRTHHHLSMAMATVGFTDLSVKAWAYGSGFPKSLDVSKAIDKRGGAVAGFEQFRDAVKEAMQRNGVSRKELQAALGNHMLSHYLTAGSQPAVPTYKDFKIIRDTVGLGDTWNYLFAAEAEREVVGQTAHKPGIANKTQGHHTVGGTEAKRIDITAPATPAAQQWSGWGTALKPAWEPVVCGVKPC